MEPSGNNTRLPHLDIGVLEGSFLPRRPTTAHYTDTSVPAIDSTVLVDWLNTEFAPVANLFRKVGIHPVDVSPVYNPYTKEMESESWGNVGAHCIAVGFAAKTVAEELAKVGAVEHADIKKITTRALIHDVLKPFEKFRAKHLKTNSGDAYTPAAYESVKPHIEGMFDDPGLVSYLMSAGRETGHNSKAHFIKTEGQHWRGGLRGTIAEQIVHLVDDMTSTGLGTGGQVTNVYLTPWERMLQSNFLDKYPFMRTEGLGVDAHGEIIPLRDLQKIPEGIVILGSYWDLQVQVSDAICHKFQSILDSSSQAHPAAFMKGILAKAAAGLVQ